MSSIKRKSIKGFIWRFSQNFLTQVLNFLISTILARMLLPEDYGLVALASISTRLALVFINTGFTSAIIQKTEITEKDLSTMFWSGLILSIFLYLIIYSVSPWLAIFYREEELTTLVRIGSLIVITSSLFSVHQAILIRNLEFQKVFIASILGVIMHGVSGVILAFKNYGPFTLIYSTLFDSIVTCVALWIITKWKPKFIFSRDSFDKMFLFNIRILMSNLTDELFNNLQSLIIGRRYSSEDLAYYNKAFNYPSSIMSSIDGSITTVLFSTLSKYQNDWDSGLNVLRRSVRTSLYVCTPLMAGLSAVARSLVVVFLTEKWIGTVDYIRLICVVCMFWPLSARTHALNAMGLSNITLRLKMIGRVLSILLLIITFRHSVKLMVIGSIISSLISTIIGLPFFAKYLNYRIKDQLEDIVFTMLYSLPMWIIVYYIDILNYNPFFSLVLQILLGIVIYVITSVVFKSDSFFYLLSIIKEFFKNYIERDR